MLEELYQTGQYRPSAEGDKFDRSFLPYNPIPKDLVQPGGPTERWPISGKIGDYNKKKKGNVYDNKKLKTRHQLDMEKLGIKENDLGKIDKVNEVKYKIDRFKPIVMRPAVMRPVDYDIDIERKTDDPVWPGPSGQLDPISFPASGTNNRAIPFYAGSLASHLLMSGDLTSRFDSIAGWMQSAGFKTGEKGWRINSDGTAEFESGYFRGDISGATGHFTGEVDVGSINIDDAWHVDEDGNMWWGASTTYAGATIKISAAGSVNFTTGTFSGSISGASGTFTGDLSGSAITGSSFTGGLIRTNSTGIRIQLNGTTNKLEMTNSAGTAIGSIYTTDGSDVILNAGDDVYIRADGSNRIHFGSSGMYKDTSTYEIGTSAAPMTNLYLSGKLDLGDTNIRESGDVMVFDNGGSETFRIGSSGKCRCADTWESSDGTDGANESGYGFINGVRSNGSDATDIDTRYAEIDVKDGLITDFDEKSWSTIDHN